MEYTIPIENFKFTGSDLLSKNTISEGLVDSGTSVLLAPQAIAKAYNSLWNPETEPAPPFSVVIGGVDFTIDPEDLRMRTANGYVSAVVAARKTILGDTFMRNVLSVFDIGSGQMHFASTNLAVK